MKGPMAMFLLITMFVLLPSTTGEGSQKGKRVVVECGENLRFLPALIRAKPGSWLTVALRNKTNLPSIKHNIVFIESGIDLKAFCKAASQSKESQYIPESYRDRIIAYSDPVPRGETVEISFVVPPKGVYYYVCSIHSTPVSQGRMIVE